MVRLIGDKIETTTYPSQWTLMVVPISFLHLPWHAVLILTLYLASGEKFQMFPLGLSHYERFYPIDQLCIGGLYFNG